MAQINTANTGSHVKKAKPIELKLVHEQVVRANNGFFVPLRAKLTRGDDVMIGHQVFIMQGSTLVGQGTTNSFGEVSVQATENFAKNDQIITYRAIHGKVEALVSVYLDKINPPKAHDAERLNITTHIDNLTGIAYCDVHVIDDEAKGFNGYRVNGFYQNQNRKLDLDAEGHTIFTLPTILDYGQTETVVFTVNDIAQRNKAVFFRPDPRLKSKKGLKKAKKKHFFTFRILSPALFLSIPLFFYSVYMSLFAKSLLEMVATKDSGLGWGFCAVICFLHVILTILCRAYFSGKRKTLAMVQDIKVKHHRFSAAKDSLFDNASKGLKGMMDDKKQAPAPEAHGAPGIISSVGGFIKKFVGYELIENAFRVVSHWFKK